jgi:hypothetical protein
VDSWNLLSLLGLWDSKEQTIWKNLDLGVDFFGKGLEG